MRAPPLRGRPPLQRKNSPPGGTRTPSMMESSQTMSPVSSVCICWPYGWGRAGGACSRVVEEVVTTLVEWGAEAKKADQAGETALHWAVLRVRHAARCQSVLKVLAKAGAKPGEPEERTPLWTDGAP
eukprot:55649-Prorocentrum_minimum.AAC.2